MQEVGEMILIPPGMWHQVYHLESSVAIAGQFMNSGNELGIFKHILKWCCGNNISDYEEFISSNEFLQLSAKDRIAFVIRKGLQGQHGKERGDLLFNELFFES